MIYAPPRLRRGRLLAFVGISLLSLGALGVLGLLASTPAVPLREVWAVLHGGGTPLSQVLILQLRLPRFTIGLLGGAMLACSGVLLQDALRNPLAGPELLGVTSGATCVVAAITILHLAVAFEAIPWLALLGGLAGGALVLVSLRTTRDALRLVLMGAALSALLNAVVIVLISYGSPNDISLLFMFLVGSLANRTWIQARLLLPWALLGIPLAWLSARTLNILQLGDDVAASLGLPVLRVRLWVLLLSTALVAAVVAVCGPISFVALLAPHIVRRLLSTSDARIVLPAAALAGAVLLSGADVVARLTFPALELPVGLWTTLLGAPLLLMLVRRQIQQQGGAA